VNIDVLRWRAAKVEASICKTPTPDLGDFTLTMNQYRMFLVHGTHSDPDICYAATIPQDNTKKEIVESLLLSNAKTEEITEVFGLTERTLDVYQELFFDMSKFLTKLDYVSYLESYPAGMGKELKLRAYTFGAEYVYYKYGNVVPKSEDQKTLVKRMFMASAYKAMEANFNPTTSKVTKVALDWSKTMLQAYAAMEKLMGQENTSSVDLVTIITSRKLSCTPDTEDEEIV
jgi:hypothetical protein